jgi:hypothetical protein
MSTYQEMECVHLNDSDIYRYTLTYTHTAEHIVRLQTVTMATRTHVYLTHKAPRATCRFEHTVPRVNSGVSSPPREEKRQQKISIQLSPQDSDKMNYNEINFVFDIIKIIRLRTGVLMLLTLKSVII